MDQSKKVFLDNVPQEASLEAVRAWVGLYISPSLIDSVYADNRGISSFSCTVTFTTHEAALEAVQALNHETMQYNLINAEINPKLTSQSFAMFSSNYYDPSYSKSIIHFSGMPFILAEDDIRALFSESYAVELVYLSRKWNSNLSNSWGFVHFSCEEDARSAMQKYSKSTLFGRTVTLSPALLSVLNRQATVTRQVFVVKASNLPTYMDDNHLSQLFGELSLSSSSVIPEAREGYVELQNQTDADEAVSILNSTVLGDTQLRGEIVSFQQPEAPPRYRRDRPRYSRWRGRIMKGQPPPMPRMQFVKWLGPYLLDAKFEDIIERREDVLDVRVEMELSALMKRNTNCEPAVMEGPLTQELYKTIFNNLIHAEETRMRVDIRQYDLKGVRFTYQRGLYVIQVPGLAEKRPSVLRGDIVKVKLADDSYANIHDGYAYYVNLDNVHVSFHRDIHQYVVRGEKFDVQFTFNRTPIKLFHRALELSPQVWQKLYASPKPKPAVMMPLTKFFGKVALNPEQSNAVLSILHNTDSPPLILHGPPGTGKTATLVEAILQISNRNPKARILVCAPSNSAVDLVASHLEGRLGKATMFRLNGFMRDPKTLDPQSLMAHCYWNNGSFDIHSLSVLMNFNIVLSTCVSSGYLYSMGVPNTHFTHIFVDEAGEAIEPETLIPIHNANALTSIVLAGDHMQLGPIVRSSTALQWKYDRSMMEHILNLSPDKLTNELCRSYRSHPELMKLYSSLFYSNKLINCANPKEYLSLLKWSELPNKQIPLMFIHSDQEEARDLDSPSWFNSKERELVMEKVVQLLRDPTLNLSADDIGIITPYRKQVQKIKQHAHALGEPYTQCKVGTVENFQGQERKVIILSLVRSREVNLAHDSKFKLGFCDNPKRLNVAISRAKDLLIIIGNGSLFGSYDPHWAALLLHFKNNNLFKGPIPTWNYKQSQNRTHQESVADTVNDDQAWPSENQI